MTESLLQTYIRLKKNVLESSEAFEKDPTSTSAQLHDLNVKAFKDFCVLFTENIMSTVGQTIDEVKYL